MPDPTIGGLLLTQILMFALLGPIVAGLSVCFTKRPTTRWFWLFSVLYWIGMVGWLWGYVTPETVLSEVFGDEAVREVEDVDYELDRRPSTGVLFLRFRASAAAVARMAVYRDLKTPEAAADEMRVPEGFEPPAWWPPPWVGRAQVRRGHRLTTDYRSVEDWLLFDPPTGEVRYLMVGRNER